MQTLDMFEVCLGSKDSAPRFLRDREGFFPFFLSQVRRRQRGWPTQSSSPGLEKVLEWFGDGPKEARCP